MGFEGFLEYDQEVKDLYSQLCLGKSIYIYIGQIENVLSYLFFNDLRELVALFEMLCYIQSSFSLDIASNVMPRNPGDLCTVNVV